MHMHDDQWPVHSHLTTWSGGVAYPPLWNMLTMYPIPPPPYGHAIGSEEVVPRSSELPVDMKSTM